jgi:hypothetical protein
MASAIRSSSSFWCRWEEENRDDEMLLRRPMLLDVLGVTARIIIPSNPRRLLNKLIILYPSSAS